MSKPKNNSNQGLCYRCGWGFFGSWACEKGSNAACNGKLVFNCDGFWQNKNWQ